MDIVPSYFYRKIEAKEFLSCLIPQLLVVITWQLEILVTALHYSLGNDKSTPIKPQYQKANSPN